MTSVSVEYKTASHAAYIHRIMMAVDTGEFSCFVNKELFKFHTELEMLALSIYNDANNC